MDYVDLIEVVEDNAATSRTLLIALGVLSLLLTDGRPNIDGFAEARHVAAARLRRR